MSKGQHSHLNESARRNKIQVWRQILGCLINGEILIFSSLSVLPVILYYGSGIIFGESLNTQAQSSFVPKLILSPDYWKQWLLTATAAVGGTALMLGLIGLPMQRKGLPRGLLLGLWIGYIVFGLVFTFHIRFAAGYHLQLLVIVALSFGPLITLIFNRLRHDPKPWYGWAPIIGALALALLFNVRDVRAQLANHRLLEDREAAREIGEIIDHSSKTVYLAYHYGTPLEYYGELSGAYWPRSIPDRDRAAGGALARSVEERLGDLGFSPEYFIITNFKEYHSHHLDLQGYLAANCSKVAESEQYLIYGLCGS